MKTRRQSVWLTAIAVAGSVALYGCGGGSSPDTTPYDQAAVDKAAQDAAAAAQAAEEARASAIATAEAAQAEAEQAARDAAAAASNANTAAMTADSNAMAGSIDVAAATSASMDAETASTAAETASSAAEAASARAAAVAHDDPAVAAAKTAAAAAAMAARMSADNAAASADAAAASVTVAMSLQAQANAGEQQAATDADNARLAKEHATNAEIYAGRAGEAAEAARVIASEVMGDPRMANAVTLSAVRTEVGLAADWASKAMAASESAAGVPAAGNEQVATSQTAAKTSAMNAATNADRATGAMIAVQGYADSNAIAADWNAVVAASAHVETLRHRVSWIVSADAEDVSSAEMNRDAAADLAPRLAENALADGGHNSQVTMARVTEMSGLASSNTAVRARVDRALSEANIDYDSAVPLFVGHVDEVIMNKPGAEVMSTDDLSTDDIIRNGESGNNMRAFIVGGHVVQSSETITDRSGMDYVGDLRVVTYADPVFDTNDVRVGSNVEVIEYDRWALGKPYEYITFGVWGMASRPDPSTVGTYFGLPDADDDRPASINAPVAQGFEGGNFVFADRNMLWQRKDGGGQSAQYNGSHVSQISFLDFTTFDDGGVVVAGGATITVDFRANTLSSEFTDERLGSPLYTISGVDLDEDSSTFSAGDNTVIEHNDTAFNSYISGGAGTYFPDDVSGGIFGSDAEEVAGLIIFSGSNTSLAYVFRTAFGGRHQSHQD